MAKSILFSACSSRMASCSLRLVSSLMPSSSSFSCLHAAEEEGSSECGLRRTPCTLHLHLHPLHQHPLHPRAPPPPRRRPPVAHLQRLELVGQLAQLAPHLLQARLALRVLLLLQRLGLDLQPHELALQHVDRLRLALQLDLQQHGAAAGGAGAMEVA